MYNVNLGACPNSKLSDKLEREREREREREERERGERGGMI